MSVISITGGTMNEALISTKGQVVIPQGLRERYHLQANTRAQWVDLGGVLMLVPKLKDPLKESRGFLKNSLLTQKALKKERLRDKKR